jgi:hypothetical protein
VLTLHLKKEVGAEKKMNKHNKNSIPVKIEQMIKQFKTHQCALDFGHGFINSVLVRTEDDDGVRSLKHC